MGANALMASEEGRQCRRAKHDRFLAVAQGGARAARAILLAAYRGVWWDRKDRPQAPRWQRCRDG